MGRPHKDNWKHDLTRRYVSGDLDEDRPEGQQRFSQRSAGAQQRKMERTALLRAAEEQITGDLAALPLGQVVQVHSLFSEVESHGVVRLCVVRKTMARLEATAIVVGDLVRFRETGGEDERGRPEAVIEQVLPRRTLLTRAESFKAMEVQPIVANAEQMLIVAAVREPRVKWGLVDRMLVAAQGGGLRPVLCLNKVDLEGSEGSLSPEAVEAEAALAYYQRLGVCVLRTSVVGGTGLETLRQTLQGRVTVLAGHSGVGKSSLIRALQPQLDLRVADISRYTGKGRHTTTSARHYALDGGGAVIDTPGVKLFGLWGLTPENLVDYFPDVADGTAPQWRTESFERIVQSLAGNQKP